MSISSALKNLERLKEELEKLKATEDMIRKSLQPYILIQPYNILNDVYSVELWADGFGHGKNKLMQVSFVELAELIEGLRPDTLLHVYMGHCLEWGHIRTQILDNRYTTTQKQAFMTRDLEENKELVQLYLTEYGLSVAAFLLCMPDIIAFTRAQYDTIEIDLAPLHSLVNDIKLNIGALVADKQ